MLTVSAMARRCGLSRTTLLYYESIGLLRASFRSAGNYRCYGDADLARLRQIRAYRDAGLKLEDIRSLLDGAHNQAAEVLQRRLVEIGAEIDTLRSHQLAIARLLRHEWRNEMISKDKWVTVMRGAGFSDEDMHRWHTEFEKSAPAEHQEFLEFLHLSAEEIHRIREWSRGAAK